MIEFVDSPTELTTAATDLILSLIAFWCCRAVPKQGERFYWRLWQSIFGLLSLAALLGALVHGLQLDDRVYQALWAVIYLALALLITAFLVISVWDVFGPDRARQIKGLAMLLGGGFFTYTLLFPSSFLPFIIYQVCVMVMALLGYLWLCAARGAPGCNWLAAGIAITIAASAIQATQALSFTFIWPFDHNGVYHFVQMGALWVLLRGVRLRLSDAR
ncbi:DUF6962 family protein [Simiduia aestuariiviva]|uniref:Uncharacterized protein n=1 Tax=Simiduia aestuariiviva TaxID=1510459 RepID=A0A839UPL1_9GAMM|nr:hypothetical protein [Simiduia aestuariiviva]MBB3167367.1 hypothetical protein [Simiduia aestuariiviva]